MNGYKKWGVALLLCCAGLFAGFTNDVFALPTVQPRAVHRECAMSAVSGEVLEFRAADLERRMGLEQGTLRGVTVTRLPLPEQGALVLDGVELEAYAFVSRDELDRLCFVPNEAAEAASLTFLPQGLDAVSTQLAITIAPAPNAPPVVGNASFSTLQNMAVSGLLRVTDADGDNVRLQLVRRPEKGEVHIDGHSFTYEPFKDRTGTDSFTVCAIDSLNQYSAEALVEIYMEPMLAGPVYADMHGNPSAFAAYKLREHGVLVGKQVGGVYFFYPEHMVSRGEFLVMLLASCGLDRELPVTVNTGLPDDVSLPMWLKPYVKKAVETGILPASSAFAYKEAPTRAEAVVLVHRASGIDDVKQFALPMQDKDALPDWSVRAYTDLAAYKMLDLHDGYARPRHTLTNAYAADLLWQLWKHSHR